MTIDAQPIMLFLMYSVAALGAAAILTAGVLSGCAIFGTHPHTPSPCPPRIREVSTSADGFKIVHGEHQSLDTFLQKLNGEQTEQRWRKQ